MLQLCRPAAVHSSASKACPANHAPSPVATPSSGTDTCQHCRVYLKQPALGGNLTWGAALRRQSQQPPGKPRLAGLDLGLWAQLWYACLLLLRHRSKVVTLLRWQRHSLR